MVPETLLKLGPRSIPRSSLIGVSQLVEQRLAIFGAKKNKFLQQYTENILQANEVAGVAEKRSGASFGNQI